ncbi:iron ABC transporter substrate-binding protein [Candidatus Bipolaricaulota bacterium]|nr:iron ABC transporter substrate-binding protein [Candidatus Bipolaricaulota bacterium]
MKRTRQSLILFLFLVLMGVAVSGFSTMGRARVLEDVLGRKVRVPGKVTRIVGIEAGTLRLITYLEATDLVVGVENFEKRDRKRPYRLAHPEFGELSNLGPIHGGDPELIVAARPEVIFWSYATEKKANDLQARTGIPVIVLNPGPPRTMAKGELESSLKMMGKVLGKTERARQVIQFIDDEIAKLKELGKDAEISGVTAYVGGIGQRGAQGINSTEPGYPPFSFIGLENSAGDIGMDHAMINEEKLIQWDPDYLFVDEAGLSLVKKDLRRAQFKGLYAVRTGNVFGLLPYNYYTTNFGTVMANAYYIGKLVYPKAFNGIDPEEKADEIYEFLVGDEVYSEMEKVFGGFEPIKLTV